ncbi:hypothetical protein TRVL_04732 [Trypanosoma vivax]|nr:hypothetical protein TRVL_04732 [Trypanosoma vivax]
MQFPDLYVMPLYHFNGLPECFENVQTRTRVCTFLMRHCGHGRSAVRLLVVRWCHSGSASPELGAALFRCSFGPPTPDNAPTSSFISLCFISYRCHCSRCVVLGVLFSPIAPLAVRLMQLAHVLFFLLCCAL